MMVEYRDDDRKYALTVDCPSCPRKAGQPCVAMNGNKMPIDRGPHYPRLKLGREYRVLREAQVRR